MEKSTEPQPCTQWFVFFKDQLLLKKRIYRQRRKVKYSVPVSIEPPLTPEAGSNIHEVFPPNGKKYVHLLWETARGRNPMNGS